MTSLQIVETPEGPVRYAQAGRGADVVLIHGAMTSLEDMLLGPFELLAEGRRVTAFDRPGHGATPRRRLKGSPADQARRLLAAMDALGLEDPVVVGHSFGGAVAMDLALQAPGRVRGVVAIAPIVVPELRLEHLLYGPRAAPGLGEMIGYGPGRFLDAMLFPVLWRAMFAPQPIPDRFLRSYPFDLATGPAQMVALGEEAMLALPDLAVNAWRYPQCETHVSVIAGTADWVAPPWRHAARLAGSLPNAELRLLGGLGHMAHHFAPDEIRRAVARRAP